MTIESNSPNDPPGIHSNYLATELGRKVLTHAAPRTPTALLDTKVPQPVVESKLLLFVEVPGGLKPLKLDMSDSELLERITLTGMQHRHSGGTAAMGSIIDVNGKVNGVEGLRVADGSIVPVALGGHLQATLYAVAEKLASAILE